MLKVEHLESLRYLGQPLLDISFTVADGEILVLLGPNGAGKSQLLEAVAAPDETSRGQILVNHFNARTDPDKARVHLGYLPSPVAVEPYLTGFEYLQLVGSIYHLSPKVRTASILQLANKLGCSHQLFTLMERLGPAARQKVGLLAALIHKPSVLVLDEPTEHLDATGQHLVQEQLIEFSRQGGAVLLATNDLTLAEQVADRLLLIDQGQSLAEGTATQLHHQFKSNDKSVLGLYQQAFLHA